MEIMKSLFLTLLLSASGCYAYSNQHGEDTDETFLLNLILKCTRTEDLGNCLKLKAVKFLDKLVRMKDPLVITEYLTLAKNPKAAYSNYQELNNSETVSEGKSSKTEEQGSENLDKMIWEKLASLFATRTIQLSLSADAFEGRGKGDKIFKKGHGLFLMAAMMGGMMMKMALGKIALIAGKALIIGKIALVLSIIIALRRFTVPAAATAAEVVYTSAEHATGRKIKPESDKDGSDLAYNAYKPDQHNNF